MVNQDTPEPPAVRCSTCWHQPHGAICYNMASDNDCECSTHEPPADDGYVSRNVYDYDEPEPPADVREALTNRAAAEAYPHRNPYMEGLAYMSEERSRIPLREAFVAGAKWADTHRPTPHVVTTTEELRNLGLGYVLIASGRYPGDTGTFENCHVRRLPEFITGTDDPLFEVLIYGDAGPHNLVGIEGINLPATVLTPAPAPVDVIHLTDFHNPSTTAMCGEPTTVVTEHGDTRPICQTCHRGAMKSAHAHAPAPVDREAQG